MSTGNAPRGGGSVDPGPAPGGGAPPGAPSPDAALAAIPLGHAERFTKTVSESDVSLFAGITGDLSPIHVDEEFGRATRFGGRLAHGALLVGFVSTVMGQMTARLPPPGGVSARYDVKFVGPVRLGDTITTELRLAETRPARRHLVFQARATNQRGEPVLEGETLLKLI